MFESQIPIVSAYLPEPFPSIGFVFSVLCCCVGGYLIGGEQLYVVGLNLGKDRERTNCIDDGETTQTIQRNFWARVNSDHL